MATVPNDAEAIRRKMAEIRHELHEDVREVVASAEAVTDWHRYIRLYPWVAVGAAFAVGYFIVPKRRPTIPNDIASSADVEKVREAVDASQAEARGRKKARKSLIGAAWALAAPLAIRAAQNYAAHYLEDWIQQQQHLARRPPTTSPTSPQAPGWGYGPGYPQ